MPETALVDLLKTALPITGPTLAGLAVFLYLFSHPEKFDQWGSLLYRFLSFFTQWSSSLSAHFEHGVVAWGVQDIINTAGERLSKQSPGVLPHALSIEWVKEVADEDAFIQSGEVIVRLKHHSNQDRNLAIATLAYLGKGLLPRARQYLDSSLRQATDFIIARQMLGRSRDTGASDWLLTHVLDQALIDNPSLCNDSTLLEDIDSVGFLSRVFLAEIQQLGERLFPAIPNERISREIRSFASYLQVIATKGQGEDVPLSFEGLLLKTSLVLVAKSPKLRALGIAPYVRAVEVSVKEDYQAIFVCGWGVEFIGSVRKVLRESERRGLVGVLRRDEFLIARHGGSTSKGILAVCKPKNSYLEKRRALEEPVRTALLECVPEIVSGEIEIVGVARIVGTGSRIAVRMTNDQENPYLATQLCLGTDRTRITAIRERLPEREWIGIIEWRADARDFISESLYPRHATDVVSIELDEERGLAKVLVKDADVAARVIGPDGCNVRLAGELVGWQIDVGVSPRPEPTDAVRAALKRHVPAITSGEVQIVAIARKPTTGSKVCLRRVGDGESSRDAVRLCRGSHDEYLTAVRNDLEGEWVSLVSWSSDPKALIIAALYPLESREVSDISLNEETHCCLITVSNASAAAKCFGRDFQNLRLAQQLVGWEISVEVAKPTDGGQDEKTK